MHTSFRVFGRTGICVGLLLFVSQIAGAAEWNPAASTIYVDGVEYGLAGYAPYPYWFPGGSGTAGNYPGVYCYNYGSGSNFWGVWSGEHPNELVLGNPPEYLPAWVSLSPPSSGTNDTNAVVIVQPVTNGMWESVISNGVYGIQDGVLNLTLVLSNSVNLDGSVFIESGPHSVFKDEYGVSWFRRQWETFFDHVTFSEDETRLKVDTGLDALLSLTNGLGSSGGTEGGDTNDTFITWEFTNSLTVVVSNVPGSPIMVTVTSSPGEGWFTDVHGSNVFDDINGVSVLKDYAGESAFSAAVGAQERVSVFKDIDQKSVFVDDEGQSWLRRIYHALTDTNGVIPSTDYLDDEHEVDAAPEWDDETDLESLQAKNDEAAGQWDGTSSNLFDVSTASETNLSAYHIGGTAAVATAMSDVQAQFEDIADLIEQRTFVDLPVRGQYSPYLAKMGLGSESSVIRMSMPNTVTDEGDWARYMLCAVIAVCSLWGASRELTLGS